MQRLIKEENEKMEKKKNVKIKLIAVSLAMVTLMSLMPAMPTSAIGGTYYYKPAESNIATKFWVTGTASSNAADADNALDGKPGTAWLAAGGGAQWYRVDLGGVYDAVRQARVVFTSPTTVYRYKLEGSADGNEWTMLSDRSANTITAEGFSDVFKFAGLRYLRYSFTSTSNIGIKNISVFNYWRDDLEGGADVSGFTSATNGIWFNSNNNPASPSIIPDGQGGYRQIRGGTFDTSVQTGSGSMNTGQNFWGLTKDMGWDTIRLRIWHNNRSESTGTSNETNRMPRTAAIPAAGTTRGPAETNRMARYIVGAGQRLGIDFHYSDNWADPQRQPKPYEWAELPFDDPSGPIRIPRFDVTPARAVGSSWEYTWDPDKNNNAFWVTVDYGLTTAVYRETKKLIEDLIKQGTAPGIIALGNEITNGMMWGSEFEIVQPFVQRSTDTFYRYIVGRGQGPRDPAVTLDPRGPAPRGGGIKWIAFEEAQAAKAAGNNALYEELYEEWEDSVEHLAKLINAGQRAVAELNDEYGLSMETELHFAFNLFEGSPKQVIDPEFVTFKNMSLMKRLGEYLDDLGYGMSDRIGLSQYPDWHGPYDYVQEKMVQLTNMFPGIKINISEVWHRNNLNVTNGNPTSSNAGWTQDPNVVACPMNNAGTIIPDWFKNPNLVPNGNPWPTGWNPNATVMPSSFTQNRLWQGQDVINHMTYLNDVPNNAGQGVWQWSPNSRGYWENASGAIANNPNSAGAQPSASFLAFTQGRAVNALEAAVYITTAPGVAPALPATVKSVDAKTGAITDVAVNWPAINASQYASEGTFTVKNVEADGVTTAISGPYWNGVRQITYPIAGTMREVTAYITVADYDPNATLPVAIAPDDIIVLNKTADGMKRALVEFDLSTASGFAEGDLGKIKPAGFMKDTYQGTTTGSTWILENRPDDTGRPAKLSAWATAEFADADVCCVGSSEVLASCPGKLVTITGITLGGTERGKYTLTTTTTTARAHITERLIRVENNQYALNPVMNVRQDFMMGIDLSSEPALRASTASPHSTNNFIFRNKSGDVEDIYKIYADHGVNYVRARVWNDPYYRGETIRTPSGTARLGPDDLYQRFHPLYGDGHGPGSYGGGNNNIDRAVEMGLRSTMYGMKLLVDFHYSDCWADPGRQYAPKSWIGMNIDQKVQALYDFTFESLEKLVSVGVDVGMVQVGNETQGQMSGESGTNYYRLVNAGCKAIDDINEKYGVNIKKSVHFANPSSNASSIPTWVNGIQNLGADLDVVLLSWYPEYTSHGTLANLLNLMNTLVGAHPRLEVGCGETDNRMQGTTFTNQATLFPDYNPNPQGQTKELYDVIAQVSRVNGGKGIGVFYWEPAWATPIDANSRRYYGTGWASRYSSHYDANNTSANSDGNIGSAQNNKNTFTATTANGGVRTPLPSMDVWSLVYGGGGRAPLSPEPTVATFVGFEDVVVSIQQGASATLPGTVTGNLDDGTTRIVPVVWDAFETGTVGTIEVFGTVDGTDLRPKAIVTIMGIASFGEVSVSAVGVAPELPATVTAIYGDASTRSVPVVWDAFELVAGTFSVYGTVAGTALRPVAVVTITEVIDFSLDVAQGVAKATLVNRTLSPLPANIIIAVYDVGGKLVEIKIENVSLAQGGGSGSGSLAIPSEYEGYTIKAFAWDSIYIPLVASLEAQAVVIKGFANVAVSTTIGAAPTLPATVTAIYSDNSQSSMPVVWDAIDASLYENAGSFTVSGTVAGTALRPTATVTVIEAPAGNLLLRGNGANSHFSGTNGDWVLGTGWGRRTSTTESRANPTGVTGERGAIGYWYESSLPSAGSRATLTITPATIGLGSIPPGQYRLEGYARSGSTGTTFFYMYATINGVTTEYAIPNTSTFTNRQLLITVPPGTAQFEIGIRVPSSIPTNAWVQVDDFSLTYVN